MTPPNIDSLVEQMTLEEKAALCIGVTSWDTAAVERLGIPAITVSDGPHGVRRTVGMGRAGLPATCFPTASALAATWDRDLIRELGQALADECIALDVDILLGPGNNMKRTPLCGRNFEYFAEDPYLGGEMATSFITAVQGKGVGTSLKHFAANNQEYDRMTVSAQISERALREIYLAGFERAVKQAQPWTVMCAYNRVNGTYASEHHRLLTSILRDEWGFEGFVVSDWGAVHNRINALAAGLELEMPGPQAQRVQAVVEAVNDGKLAESILNQAVARLLRIVFKAQETPKGDTEIDVEAHHALARRIAAEAIVLLKNKGDLLPLRDVSSIAVIGTGAKQARFQGGGSSHITPTRVDVPFDELQKRVGDSVTLTYAAGDTPETGIDQTLIDEAVAVAEQAEVALLYIALPESKENEGADRVDIDLTEQQIALIKAVCARQPRTVVILNNGSAVAMKEWIDGPQAVLEAWLMGQAGGGAIADVLFGDVNPSGRLAETFPLALVDTPAYLNYPGEARKVVYGEGLFIGYRYYDTKQKDVLFPFGYGLSYTTFAFSNLQVSSDTFKDVDGVQVTLDVTNTGAVAGKATVQLYVHDHEAALLRPEKELKGFAKVALEPGETRSVTLDLDSRAFAYYDPSFKQWVTESGAFDILIGHSAADIALRKTVQLESTLDLTLPLTRDSSFRDWMEHPRGAEILGPLFQQMLAQATEEVNISGEAFEWMKDLPLEVVLMFAAKHLPKPPEQVRDDLLAQVNG